MLRVLTLSTLFPNAAEPNFGCFVEEQTLRLAARSDVQLRVVSPLGSPPFPLNLHPRYRQLRALPRQEAWKGLGLSRPRFLTVPGLSGALNPASIYRTAVPVLDDLRKSGFAFDIIDAEFFYPDGPAAARLAARFGVPFSIKARGADIHYWGARSDCRRIILDAAARSGGLLAVAGSLKQDMVRLGMDPGKISVHYTGVDLEAFRVADREAAKAQIGVAGPLVVSVGALIPRKGHDLVIKAMAALPTATLLIAGAGPQQAALSRLVSACGLGERVRLLGGVAHGQLPLILGAADVMALASESEGLANAWIEAMACGTPVVAPDVDGAAEAIDTPVSGRLLSERTPAAIASAIASILSNPPLREAVRANAERFSWSRNTQTLFEHLQRIKADHISGSSYGSPVVKSALPDKRSSSSQRPVVPMPFVGTTPGT